MTATRSATGVVVVLLLAVAAVWSLSRSYYVALAERQVVIYQGVPASVGPLELSWAVEETSLSETDVSDFVQRQLEAGIPAVDLRDARNVVDSLRDAG